MAKDATKTTAEPAKLEAAKESPKTGTGVVRPVGADGIKKITIPGPQIDKPDSFAVKIAEKKQDPHKPKDAVVTSAHIIETMAGSLAQNRMTRLIELSRRSNDVKWLLAEYQKLSTLKK